MTKKSKSDLTQQERVLNKWTGERRRKQEERYLARRPEDPDEDTIRLACSEIRSTWSPYIEHERRVTRCGPVTLLEFEHPKSNGQYVYPSA